MIVALCRGRVDGNHQTPDCQRGRDAVPRTGRSNPAFDHVSASGGSLGSGRGHPSRSGVRGLLGSHVLGPRRCSLSCLERRFSSEDLNKICRVLDAQRIEYRTDDQHRIAVDADQFDQAAALVAKLDVGPRPIDEARDQLNSWSVLIEGPREREQREKLAREKIVESMIRKLPGITWTLVSINRPARLGLASHGREADGVCLHRDRE